MHQVDLQTNTTALSPADIVLFVTETFDREFTVTFWSACFVIAVCLHSPTVLDVSFSALWLDSFKYKSWLHSCTGKGVFQRNPQS